MKNKFDNTGEQSKAQEEKSVNILKTETYIRLLENLPVGVFVLDRKGNPIYANSCAQELLGKDIVPDIEPGKLAEIYEVFTEDEKTPYPSEKMPIVKALKGEKSFIDDMVIRRPDGFLPIEVHAAPILNEDGEIEYSLAVFFDIKERKTAEKTKRQSDALLSTITSSAPDGIIMIDNEGNITFWNEAASKIFQYSEQEVLGKNLHLLLAPPDYHEQHHKGFAKFKNTGKGEAIDKTLELTAICKDGTEIPIELSLTAISLNNEWNALGIVRDISTRKRLEEKLRIIAQFAELDPAPVIRFDKKGNILHANPAALEFLYKGNSQVDNLHELIPDLSDFQFDSIINEGQILNQSIQLDGKHYNLTLKGVYDLNIGIIYFSDITELIKTTESLQDAQASVMEIQKMESLGRLAGSVAHDFNNLLTVIMGNAKLAQMDIDKDDPLFLDLEKIQSAAKKGAEITSKILAFGRRQTFELKVINLNQVIIENTGIIKSILGEEIELITDLAEDLKNVELDPAQIELVIANIASNGKDAMPRGGKLTIGTKNLIIKGEEVRKYRDITERDYVLLTFKDTGIGMDEETISHIFEPFFTTKGRRIGTGLGLATVYGIIKQSGGDITVVSAVSEGVKFSIILPATELKIEETPIQIKDKPKKEEPIKDVSDGKTILVIEDEEEVRDTVVRFLKVFGYNVISARSGGEALLICEKLDEKVDLILSDVMMPNMSGPECVEIIKEEFWKDVKVLYMSGYTEDIFEKYEFLRDSTILVRKPFEPEYLRSIIANIIAGE